MAINKFKTALQFL